MNNCKCRDGAGVRGWGREATQGAAEQVMGDGANLDYMKLLGILTSSTSVQKKAGFFLKLERQ